MKTSLYPLGKIFKRAILPIIFWFVTFILASLGFSYLLTLINKKYPLNKIKKRLFKIKRINIGLITSLLYLILVYILIFIEDFPYFDFRNLGWEFSSLLVGLIAAFFLGFMAFIIIKNKRIKYWLKGGLIVALVSFLAPYLATTLLFHYRDFIMFLVYAPTILLPGFLLHIPFSNILVNGVIGSLLTLIIVPIFKKFKYKVKFTKYFNRIDWKYKVSFIITFIIYTLSNILPYLRSKTDDLFYTIFLDGLAIPIVELDGIIYAIFFHLKYYIDNFLIYFVLDLSSSDYIFHIGFFVQLFLMIYFIIYLFNYFNTKNKRRS